MQDVIQDKLDHLQQQQLDIDHLDVETKKLNDKVLLIQSDIEKDQRTLSDIKVDLVLKDIEISAAKGVANHLDLEMNSQSAKLKFIRDCTTEKKEKYQSRLHEFSLEFGYLSGAKIQEQQEQILQELESLKHDKCQVQQLQFELDKALETKGNLEWQLERASTFQSLIQDKIQSYEAENDSKADLIIQSMNERSQL